MVTASAYLAVNPVHARYGTICLNYQSSIIGDISYNHQCAIDVKLKMQKQ